MKIKTLFPLNLQPPVKLAACAIAIAVCFFFITSARATDYTSTNSDNWSTPTTWSPNGTPGAGDTATIASGNTVTLTTNIVCSGVTNNSGGVLDESSSVYTLSLSGNFVNNGTFKAGSSAPVVIFTTTGTTTATYQVTPGVTNLTVECWGGGGAGGSIYSSTGSYGVGGGGGGGAYSKTAVFSLASNGSYAVQVGGGGSVVSAASGNAGGDSYFNNATTAKAAGGGGGGGGSGYHIVGAAGAGGATANGTGIGYAGGSGVAGRAPSGYSGGGGGGGAGTLAAGGDGIPTMALTNSFGGLGGAVGGGNGGNGSSTPGATASNGSALGGGGGGSYSTSSTTKNSIGGAGAPGQVVLTWPLIPVNATKANNANNLNLTASWTGAAVPNATGIATWDSTVTSSNTVALGTNLAFGGITILNPAGLVTISADGNALTLNGPIDMSSATADLSLSCPLVMGAANVWTVTNTHTLTVGGAISGSAGITKQGSGTAILSGTNTYSGVTTVSAGELDITNWGAATLGTIFVGPSAATTATLGIKNGTLYFGANPLYVGLGASAIGVVNQTGGSVSFTGGGALLVGNGATGTYNLSGGTLTSFASSSRGVMLGVNPNAFATFNLSGSGTLSLATAELAVGRNDAGSTGCTVTYNQTGGAATVGYLSIGGQSGSTGTTATFNITNGTFVATNFQNFVAAASSTATLYLGGGAQVTLPAFPTKAGAATNTFDFTTGYLAPYAASASYMPAGTFDKAFLTAHGVNFNVGSGNDITVGQVFRDAAPQAGTLTKSGAGTLTLSGANNYSGNTTVSAGTLVIAQATLAAASTVSISNGAVLNLGFSTTNLVAGLITNGVSLAAGVYNNGNLASFIAGTGSLQVVGSSGPSGPAKLTNSISGSTLSLSWPAGQGWRLQQQTNSLSVGLRTNWVYITDGTISSTNITVYPTNPTVFFRLAYP